MKVQVPQGVSVPGQSHGNVGQVVVLVKVRHV